MDKRSKKKKHERAPKRGVSEKDRALSADLRSLQSRTPLRKSHLIDLALIFGLAFVLRIVFFFLNKANNPLFYQPIMDSLYHLKWAQEILSGNFWGSEVFFRAPLYPYLLAFLYKLGGSSIGFVSLVQHLIGSLTCVLVYLLSREFFSRNVSLLAGLFAALYWPFIYYEGELLIVTLILFLDLLLLWCLAIALKRWDLRYFLAAGLLLGLSAIARPSILVMVLVLPIVIRYGATARREQRPKPRWMGETALVLAGAAIVILPVIIRNYVIGRDIVPIASQGGVNFFIGNNPESDGRTAVVPGTRPDWWGGYYDTIERAERDMGRKLKPSEVSNYYFRKGFEFIFSSPGQAARLFLRKFYLFWSAGERSNNKYIYFFWHLSGMGRIPLPGFWLITPLAILGGVLLWRQRARLALLYLFVVSYMLGVVAFFVNARFRLPVVPVLIVFAAYGVFYFVVTYRHRSFLALKALLILALCVFAVNYDLLTFRENKTREDSISHYSLGNAYLKMRRKDLALSEYEKARETYERYPVPGYRKIARNVDYNMGTLYWEMGLCSRAIPALERVGGSDEYAIIAKENLADCYLKKGRVFDAIRLYEQILSLRPQERPALIGLARAYRSAGMIDRSETILRSLLERPDHAGGEVDFELALIMEQRGDINGALECFEAAARDPSYRADAYLGMARIYHQIGKENEAREYLSRARALQQGQTPTDRAIDALRGAE